MGIGNFNLLVFDLAGIFVFAIGGATMAVRRGLDLFGVLVLACVAATAGGILRDILIADVPHVLYKELYAVAALSGAIVVVAAHALGLPELPSALAAGTLCFVLRFMGIRYGWRLPVSQRGDPPA